MNRVVIASIFIVATININLLAKDNYEAYIKWTAPTPDSSKTDAGFDYIEGAKHYTVFPTSKEIGTFNHGPMLSYYDGKLFVVWYSHAKYENAPGTRAVFAYTEQDIPLDHSQMRRNQFIRWSQPQILIDSLGEMTEKGKLGAGIWPKFEQINGKLFCTATVKKMVGWGRDGAPSAPIFENLPRLAKHIAADGELSKDTYWLSNSSPEGFEYILPFHKAEDKELRNTLTMLHERTLDRRYKYTFPQADDGARFCEPTYYTRPDGKEVGIFRDQKMSMRLYSAIRNSPQQDWSKAVQTNIYDSPSKTVAGTLPAGKVFIIGNFLNELWLRDPLLLATSEDGINFDKAYIIRAGAPQVMDKSQGDHKGPGFDYPNAIVVGDSIWVSYSICKEQIAVSRIPIDSLK